MPHLIEPVQSGNSLIRDIHQTTVSTDQVAIWWLGQSGFAIKTSDMIFYIDLYLSEHLTRKYAHSEKPHIRMTRAPIVGEDLNDVRWLFASHKHSDHLDPESVPIILRNNPDARLILPLAEREYAISLGLPSEGLIATRGNETLTIGSMQVHVIPSAHPELAYSDDTGYPFLGYIFDVNDICIYHSGDTLVYDGLAGYLNQYQIDIALLPINGTSERLKRLKIPPDMNITEALELANCINKPMLIPHHYDMFTFNTVAIDDFVRQADAVSQPYKVMQCGEKFIWQKL